MYEDIMHLPHHVSPTRPQMPMRERAAQFAPFAALTGYDDAILEAGRLTDAKMELDDEALNTLNAKLLILSGKQNERPAVTITYFKPDDRKAGGAHIELTGFVKRIDVFEQAVIMQDGAKIPMEDILSIDEEQGA